jgi:hypothetical protein
LHSRQITVNAGPGIGKKAGLNPNGFKVPRFASGYAVAPRSRRRGSTEEAAGGDDTAEPDDERDVGEAGDDDAAEAPEAVWFCDAEEKL